MDTRTQRVSRTARLLALTVAARAAGSKADFIATKEARLRGSRLASGQDIT
jgi:hypothetical protein